MGMSDSMLITCHDCHGTRPFLRTVRHPDGYRLCLHCYWVIIERRLDDVVLKDHRFKTLDDQRTRIAMYIAGYIGRARALLWHPKEILRAYSKDVLKIIISNPPENKRAKIGKVVWI